MKILLAHNRYQLAGGEDAVVAAEHDLLAENGHNVRLFSVTNDAIAGLSAKLRAAARTAGSAWGRDAMAREIAAFRPDIVHVHNFFPLLSPSVYDACRDAGVAVVQTLHNYRLICPGGLLMRGGRPCEDCVGASPWRAVLHRCYRGSALGSAAVARMVDTHRRRGTWRSKVDRFIALTEFARSKFAAAGFPADRIAVKPNFVADRARRPEGDRAGALFVGRLSTEKGIATLLSAWRTLDMPLRIAGTGPMEGEMLNAGLPTVTMLGHSTAEAVAEEMARAAFLLVPSVCYENFPVTLAEAFCQGLPVIASRLGAMAEIVEDGVTGLHFTAGDAADLAAKVRWAADHPEDMRRMGRNARRIYEEKYTPAANYTRLRAIYDDAIGSRAVDRRHSGMALETVE